ncbi:MAG: signal peptidase I [Clostridiales bacterium]|nr:signal peptidase I [Clostridiales bacterium]
MEKKTKNSFGRRLPSIIGIIICVLLAPILAMNLTIVIKSYTNPDRVPDFFGVKPFVVVTGSMEPAIFGGDLVVTKTVDPAALNVKDIIAFKDGTAVITHRIMELTEVGGEPAFITQGDANASPDEKPVLYSQVEGIFVFRVARLGHLAMFMQTPVGMIVFVGIPLCGFILYDIIRRRLSEKKEKSEERFTDLEAQAEIERLRAALAAKEEIAGQARNGNR